MELVKLISELGSAKSWTVTPKMQKKFDLPDEMKQRYVNFPQDWITFISNFKQVVNSGETIWFLCTDDFDVQDEDAFRWNEWERISLQAAIDDKDSDWQNNIREFWDSHLPIMLSVANGYEYYAIRLSDGVIVNGCEPEFEECLEVADSFSQFVEKIVNGKIDLD